jgi:hypothetical protein
VAAGGIKGDELAKQVESACGWLHGITLLQRRLGDMFTER